MIDLVSKMFKGYGKFLLLVMLALIAPELTHQHFNYSSFSSEVRVLSRYGFLFIALGLLIKDVLISQLEAGGAGL